MANLLSVGNLLYFFYMSNKRNEKAIKKVKEFRKKGLTYRAIMRIMKMKDVKQIFRWANYK